MQVIDPVIENFCIRICADNNPDGRTAGSGKAIAECHILSKSAAADFCIVITIEDVRYSAEYGEDADTTIGAVNHKILNLGIVACAARCRCNT